MLNIFGLIWIQIKFNMKNVLYSSWASLDSTWVIYSVFHTDCYICYNIPFM